MDYLYEIVGIDMNDEEVIIEHNLMENEVDKAVRFARYTMGMEHVFWRYQGCEEK